MALLCGLCGLLWLAWSVASGPEALRAGPGTVEVGAGPRVDLAGAVQVRAARPEDNPRRWTVHEDFGSAEQLSSFTSWVRVRLQNPHAEPFEGLLALRAPLLRGVSAYMATTEHFDTELAVERPHRFPAASVVVPANGSIEVLMRVQGLSDRVPMELWTPQAFLDAEARADWALGILLGLIFAVALYHLGNVRLQRDSTNLAFLAVALSWSIHTFLALGHGFAQLEAWLPPATVAVDAFGTLSLAALMWFARHFFEVGEGHASLRACVRGLEWGLLVVALLAFGGMATPASFEWLALGVCTIVVFYAARARGRQGFISARAFLIAWVPGAFALLSAEGVGLGQGADAATFLVASAAAAFALYYAVAERVAINRDRRATELDESRERYAYAARGTNDGLFDLDLIHPEKSYLSPRFFETLHLPVDAVAADPESLQSLVFAEDRSSVMRSLRTCFDTPHETTLQVEFRANSGDGQVRWVMMRALMVRTDGRVTRLVGSVTDIHSRKRNEIKLEHRAFSDQMTGLANRARVLQHLEVLLDINRDQPELAFGVLFIDVDGFKKVNDSLGHAAGDSMIAALGRRLSLVARDDDLVGRLGGDEFVLVLAGCLEIDDLERIARRVLEAFAAPVALDGLEVRPTASIGITHSKFGYDSVAKVLEDADVAMFEAKRSGKARYVTFDAKMRERVREHLELEADLRHALELDQIEVYYQPIIRASDRRLAGFEALLRWNHPERGLVSPGIFIPLAEETGMVRHLGRFALYEATKQISKWQEKLPNASDWFVTVNVSPAQFGHDLQHEVLSALCGANIEPNRLKLEITEGLYLGDTGAVKEEMKRIAETGVQFSLDDFGTGYSSLSYLHDLPFSTLKVDRSFMMNLLEDPQSDAIVRSVLGLAQGLEMATVAEGVETLEVVDRMVDLDTTYFQGFFFGRPRPPMDLEEELRAKGYLTPAPVEMSTAEGARRARRYKRSADRRLPDRSLGRGPVAEGE